MSDSMPYRDASLPLDERVDDLLARMSLDEKLAQIGSVWSTELVEDGAFSSERAEEHLRHGTGHVTRIGGATGRRPRVERDLAALPMLERRSAGGRP